MKKVISMLIIFIMIVSIAACGNKDNTNGNAGGNEITAGADNKKDTEPTKAPAATAAPEPTKEVQPTAEPEPTEEPDDPDIDEDDEVYSDGHMYEGLWQSGNCIISIVPEGAADIVITEYYTETDQVNYGAWNEYWTEFIPDENRFVSYNVNHVTINNGEYDNQQEEGFYSFEAEGENLVWDGEVFTKISDDIWDNPFIVSPDDNDYGNGGDYGDGFGAEFTLEDQEFIDVIATTYYGVYCQSADDPMVGTYYPYYGDEMSMETMDESNAAFLYLGMEEDQGQLCFLEKGMNEDVTWSLGKDEFGTYILLDDGYTGEVYKGRFYWDYENTRILVMIRIGEYDLWLTSDTRVIADTSSSRTMDEETALRAIEKYLAENDESMYEKLQTGDYGTADGVYTDEENGTIVVWLRTYTGAYRNYYIDPDSGETYVTETSPLTDNSVETPTDETLNAWDYAD